MNFVYLFMEANRRSVMHLVMHRHTVSAPKTSCGYRKHHKQSNKFKATQVSRTTLKVNSHP